MAVLLLFISGCGSSQDDCANYCFQQDYPNCTAGGWEILGMYPNCTCNYICPEGRDYEPRPVEIETPPCTDECDASECLENKQYDCVIGADGCKDKAELRIIKGKCGVDCMLNSDCGGTECIAYKCKAAASSLSLSNLPKPFSDDAILVVGGNAPASDVAAAGKVSAMLIYEGKKTFETKLDNQVTSGDYAHNLILIGNPCDNSIVEKVFGIECDGTELTDNQALLKLADSEGKAALLISGGSPAATMSAAEKVANYASSGLSGSEMVINA